MCSPKKLLLIKYLQQGTITYSSWIFLTSELKFRLKPESVRGIRMEAEMMTTQRIKIAVDVLRCPTETNTWGHSWMEGGVEDEFVSWTRRGMTPRCSTAAVVKKQCEALSTICRKNEHNTSNQVKMRSKPRSTNTHRQNGTKEKQGKPIKVNIEVNTGNKTIDRPV